MGFIFAIGDAIKGIKIRDVTEEVIQSHYVISRIFNLLKELETYVDEIPPAEQQQRFGNKAFRDWHKRLTEVSASDKLVNLTAYSHDFDYD